MSSVDMPNPAHPTGTDLLVLHALRCMGFTGGALVDPCARWRYRFARAAACRCPA